MLKEMSVNFTENVLVIFCQYIIRFFTDFFFYSVQQPIGEKAVCQPEVFCRVGTLSSHRCRD